MTGTCLYFLPCSLRLEGDGGGGGEPRVRRQVELTPRGDPQAEWRIVSAVSFALVSWQAKRPKLSPRHFFLSKLARIEASVIAQFRSIPRIRSQDI